MIPSSSMMPYRRLPLEGGRDEGMWQEELAQWGGGMQPEQELTYTASHEVELKFGHKTVSLGDPAGVAALPRKAGIYMIYVNGNIWYVGRANSIRERFQERMKAFRDFRISPAQYLPLLKPVTVRWYEVVRFTDPPGSSFKTRGESSTGAWRKISTRAGLLIALESHFISKHGTDLLGNTTKECARGGGPITIIYDFGASRKPREEIPRTVFCKGRPTERPKGGKK